MHSIRVQHADFDAGAELALLREASAETGAVAMFVGTVSERNDGAQISTLELEHYPGMTEKSIAAIVDEAQSRWPLLAVRVIHRIGRLAVRDQIVFVGVASRHREAAFAACEFIMDFLKTRAPLWKKEQTENGARWVDARASDEQAVRNWKDS